MGQAEALVPIEIFRILFEHLGGIFALSQIVEERLDAGGHERRSKLLIRLQAEEEELSDASRMRAVRGRKPDHLLVNFALEVDCVRSVQLSAEDVARDYEERGTDLRPVGLRVEQSRSESWVFKRDVGEAQYELDRENLDILSD